MADFLGNQFFGLVVGYASVQVVRHALHDVGMPGGMDAERPAEGLGTGAAVCAAEVVSAGKVVVLLDGVVAVLDVPGPVQSEVFESGGIGCRKEHDSGAATLSDDDVLDAFLPVKAVRLPLVAVQLF